MSERLTTLVKRRSATVTCSKWRLRHVMVYVLQCQPSPLSQPLSFVCIQFTRR